MFEVSILKNSSFKELADINALTNKLSLGLVPPAPLTMKALERMLRQENFYLFTIQTDGKIIALIVLYLTQIPTGLIAELEDLIVDENYRKWGLGPLLIKKAIEIAEKAGAKHISSRTHPKRLDANKLYKAMGFQKMETNFYRINLPRKRILRLTII